MTKAEVTDFLEKIKVNYNEFPIKEDYIFREWYKALKDYDAYDVYLKLEEHLSGDYKNNLPKPNFIIKYLKKSDEKLKPAIDYVIDCNLCGKTVKLSDYSKHYEKCSSIKYLVKIMNEKGFKVEYSDLAAIDSKKFDLLYGKYKDY